MKKKLKNFYETPSTDVVILAVEHGILGVSESKSVNLSDYEETTDL